jgi:hypothetical protein
MTKNKEMKYMQNVKKAPASRKKVSQKLTRAEANEICLTPLQVQILLGTILGDGSLKKQTGYANVRFQMRHSIINLGLFYWKMDKLRSISTANSVHIQKPDGFSKKHKLHFQTRALPVLTRLHELCYKNNKLFFSKSWLPLLNEVSLMVWWLDDGGKIGRISNKGKLSTHGFTRFQNKLLQKYLLKRWHIRTYISRQRKKKGGYYYFLEMNITNLKKFLRIIMPVMPVPQMLYKFYLPYKDKNLRDSWIQEMILYMPHLEPYIYEYLEKRGVPFSHLK